MSAEILGNDLHELASQEILMSELPFYKLEAEDFKELLNANSKTNYALSSSDANELALSQLGNLKENVLPPFKSHIHKVRPLKGYYYDPDESQYTNDTSYEERNPQSVNTSMTSDFSESSIDYKKVEQNLREVISERNVKLFRTLAQYSDEDSVESCESYESVESCESYESVESDYIEEFFCKPLP